MNARLLAALVCAGVLVVPLRSQSFLGSITGTVQDPSGSMIAHATVIATETGTGIHRETISTDSGDYLFGALTPGTYTVRVGATGFKDALSDAIVLAAQQTRRFDARLEVGSSTESIQVSAPAPSLNTENAEITGTVTRAEFLNDPLNQRSTISFFFLNSFNYQGEGSSYSIGGLRGVNTNFTIDGVTSNSSLFGGQSGPQTEESLESVREMKLMASNNSAEFSNVASVLIESRSGANQVHGSAFFNTSNNALNARNFFSDEKSPGPIRHQFGASLGGPIVIPKMYDGHNRTFFYFSWEQQKFPGASTGTGNVPTTAMRGGDFSSLLADGTVITDPATGKPFEGNIIPKSRLSPVSLALQDFGFLLPTFGPPDNFSGNWRGYFPESDYDNRYVTRMDHRISDSDSLSGRLSIRDLPEPAQYDADLPIFYHNQHRRTVNTYVSETHIFTPTFLNEFRAAYSRDHSSLAGVHQGGAVVKQVGLQGVNSNTDLAGVPELNFQNFSNFYEFPTYFYTSQTSEFLDNVTLVRGRHNIKAGVLARHNIPNISALPGGDFGSFSFDGFATGFDYADFLLGLPHTSTREVRNPPSYWRNNNIGLFVQDAFQMTPKLTLTFGLRWEFNQPPTERNDQRFGFDPGTGNLVVPNQKVIDTLVSPVFPAGIPIVTASQAHFPSPSLLESRWRDFAPRFSFAYRPLAGGRMVIRGGYGIFYSPLINSLLSPFSGGPFQSTENYTNSLTNGTPAFSFPNPFGGSAEIPAQSIDAVSKNLRTPNVQQWNVTLERELPGRIVASATYRGFRTNQLAYTRDLNTPQPSTNPDNANLFRYENFYNAYFTEDGGIQKLHALDLRVERKLSSGVTFQSQYSLGKNLSDVGNDGERATIDNPYDRARDMANVSFMPRHRWVTQALYELPFGRGKQFGSGVSRWTEQAIGGWQLTSVFIVQTGQFLTADYDNGEDIPNNRTFSGRPDCIGDANAMRHSIDGWWNAKAFALPASGSYGNCGRNTLVGPGIVNLDLGFMKNFHWGERAKFQLRATATNSLNHPLWRNPNTTVTSANFGRITNVLGTTTNRASAGAGYRIIEVGGRIDF